MKFYLLSVFFISLFFLLLMPGKIASHDPPGQKSSIVFLTSEMVKLSIKHAGVSRDQWGKEYRSRYKKLAEKTRSVLFDPIE